MTKMKTGSGDCIVVRNGRMVPILENLGDRWTRQDALHETEKRPLS